MILGKRICFGEQRARKRGEEEGEHGIHETQEMVIHYSCCPKANILAW